MNKKIITLFIFIGALILLLYKYNNKGIINNTIEKKQILHIIVDIDSNKLYLYDIANKEIIKEYTVATGKWSTPTPTGTYKIIEKAAWGGGFGSKWMRINVPWGQYGIHGTNEPRSIGYAASHGCVRMKNTDIDELYNMVKYGTKVTLFKGTFGPFAFGFRVLKPGDRGEDVMEVQRRLKELGYYNGSIDGVYGDNMKSALLRFQKNNDIKITDWITPYMYKKLNIVLFE